MTDQSTEPTPSAFDEVLQTITTDDGRQKYSDVESALNSIGPAQEHIAKLEDELKEAREQLSGQQSFEEVVKQLRSELQQTQSQPKPGDPPDITKLVDERMEAREAEKASQENKTRVVGKFAEVYGDKASEQFESLAAANGLNVDFIMDLAAKSPDAVFKLAGMNIKETPPGKTTSTVNTDTFQPEAKPETPPSVMFGATTKDMVDAWNFAGKSIQNS